MAISTYSSYRTKREAPYQRIQLNKNIPVTALGRHTSLWTQTPLAGVAPTTAVVPTNATAGAVGQKDAAVVQRLLQLEMSYGLGGTVMLCDRLAHSGGLDGTSTGTQTTNLPTPALTRYTSGTGVFAALEIYGILGVSGTTVTASYTNQAGAGTHTSQATLIGGAGFREVARTIILPLQQGDSGVRSVESVTLLATTGTVGNFGVTLFRPLVVLPNIDPWQARQMPDDALVNMGGQIAEIVNGACLYWVVMPFSASAGVLAAEFRFAED